MFHPNIMDIDDGFANELKNLSIKEILSVVGGHLVVPNYERQHKLPLVTFVVNNANMDTRERLHSRDAREAFKTCASYSVGGHGITWPN